MKREFSPKKFWILKFFGLRQNLTRQLPAQIKKVYSKFLIFHTFRKYLNCGTKFFFGQHRAECVLIFFWFHDLTHFDVKIFEIQNFFFIKIFLDTKPIDCLNTNFFKNCFLALKVQSVKWSISCLSDFLDQNTPHGTVLTQKPKLFSSDWSPGMVGLKNIPNQNLSPKSCAYFLGSSGSNALNNPISIFSGLLET